MPLRNTIDWVEELKGGCGVDRQADAYRELANYLYVVAYNYLRLRQADLRVLAGFAPEELAALAQDFVQETLEKLARDNFALLAGYSGAGRFTSWAAQIVRNQAAMELRKSYWTRRDPAPSNDPADDALDDSPLVHRLPDAATDADPARRLQQRHVEEILHRCLDGLPERNRVAIVGSVAGEQRAEQVAQTLNTTANAVYLLVTRGKRMLRECLQSAGLTRDVLALFEPS